MKRLIVLLVMALMVSCQQEELTILEEQQENEEAAALDAQLRGLLQSVASHDGSYDDVVDKSSCFSIDFPYQVFYNGEPYQVNTIADLQPFGEDDTIIPVFPIHITYTDYQTRVVQDASEFQSETDKCNAEQLFNEKVTCVDLVYPVRLAVYDAASTDFETVVLDHDKLTFESLAGISADMIVSLNYPMELKWDHGAVVRITSNDRLRSEILEAAAICN